MTNHARKRITNWKRKNIMRVASWNVKTLNNKEQEIVQELKNHKIDIAALQETKKKGKGQKAYGEYIVIYSGIDKSERAKEGVAVALHKKYIDQVENCQYISSRIILVKLMTDSYPLNIVSIYAPEDNKVKQEREVFFNELESTIDSIPPRESTIILGDFNARIGNEPIPGVMQQFNEPILNDNGKLMINLCSLTSLRINNTFFDHKMQHKYTFHNTRGQQSVIDYIVTNRSIPASEILDVRVLNSANVGSDHGLLLGKLRIKCVPKRTRKHPEKTGERIKVDSLWDPTIRELYKKRLEEKIELNQTGDLDDVNIIWSKLKTNIKTAAIEAVGTVRHKGRVLTENKTPWFCEEVKNQCKRKRQAYIKYLTTRTDESYKEYKEIRNETGILVRQIKDRYWENFSKRLESDFYGLQKQMWRFIRSQKKEVSELIPVNQIGKKTWTSYLQDLYKGVEVETPQAPPSIVIENSIAINESDIRKALNKLKNRKSPGQDDVTNELLKYGGERLVRELTFLTQKIFEHQEIPDEWRTSTTILLFKKGDKKVPGNYRGINLLSSTLKLVTKVITNVINERITLCDEQQGFRSGRSCTDAVFVIRQITEKSIEYNKPAFFCFIDLEKAFDRIRLEDIVHLLYDRQIPSNIIRTIEDIYRNNRIQAKIDNELTEPITVERGIRQGDSLSPLLFNIIMDEIIRQVRRKRGYRMGDREVKILCYADDAVLIAENEDDLQRLLYTFNTVAKTLGMTISISKTKCMTTSKTPLRCKLVVDDKAVHQEMKFRYLGIEISSFGDIEPEVRAQAIKATRTAAQINDTIFRNKHLKTEVKARIYKTTIRPILTYAAETRPETSKTRQIMETTEMKIIRRIAGKTLRDRERSADIRQTCQIENINDWVLSRKIEWNDHITRMTEERIVKIARDKSPSGRRSTGRPRKRWSDNLPP